MENQTRIVNIELIERKGDKTAVSFPAVISTEERYSYDHGDFVEILSHAPGAIDLSRSPLPLLESHDSNSLPIGVIDNLRIIDKKLKCDVRFGNSARAIEVAADVASGIIRSLSVGYSIASYTEDVKDGIKTITATKWMPYEASAVAVAADAEAGFNRGKDMTTKNNNQNNSQSSAVEQERSRCADITRAASLLKVSPRDAASFISSGISADDARAEMLDGFESRMPNHISDEGGRADMSGDHSGSDFRSAAVDALLMRSGAKVANPHAAARDVSARVADLARVCISRAGITVYGGSTEKLIKRALTTSDFSYILQDATHKATLQGYEEDPSSHRAWVRVQPVADFKPQNRAILGSAPALAEVLEHGEYTYGSLSDEGTSYTVKKYGKIVSISWEALVNDDIGALLRVQPSMGMAARRLEADLVYDMFAENAAAGPMMQDGDTLFHANHANITTTGALTASLLGEARSLLRKVQALDGGYMSLVPRFMLVPPEIETEAELILAAATKHTMSSAEGETPRWLQGLELVVEPRLASNACYLAADNAQVDTAELGLLDENMSGPTLEEEQSFGIDSMAYKVRLVAGAKFLDYRGMVKVPLA